MVEGGRGRIQKILVGKKDIIALREHAYLTKQQQQQQREVVAGADMDEIASRKANDAGNKNHRAVRGERLHQVDVCLDNGVTFFTEHVPCSIEVDNEIDK